MNRVTIRSDLPRTVLIFAFCLHVIIKWCRVYPQNCPGLEYFKKVNGHPMVMGFTFYGIDHEATLHGTCV